MELAGADCRVAVFGMRGFVDDAFQQQRLRGVIDGLGDRFEDILLFPIEWNDGVMMLAGDIIAAGPQAVATTTAGADLLCGTLAIRGLTDAIEVAAVGYIDSTYLTYFANGSLDYNFATYGEQVAGPFILMYNWLNNGIRWASPGKSFAWVEVPFVSIPDLATMEIWLEYSSTVENSPFTIDDVRSMLVRFNREASLEDFAALMWAVSLEEVKARRG
jgi:hypothetical protein